ncbi:hypothetical protein ACQKWADRAFT_324601 [Trichoderma austrokoningii]
MASLSLKPRRPPFGTTIRQNISFLHPGYPDGHNILFTLPAYYFRIQNNHQYPVVPSLDNFLCPVTLPGSWDTNSLLISPATTDDVGQRDQTCRVTASLLSNETAPIVPQALSEWWQRNNMFMYTTNPDLSSDTRCADNAILLRRDLHKMWDDHRFAIVPKADRWVIHVLWNSPSDELETEYHNLELQPLHGVARHFLFCRFALAILSRSIFLNQTVPRKLITLDSEGTPQVRTISAREAKSRSQSPKKRQRSVQGNGEVDDDEYGSHRTSSSSEEEEERGGWRLGRSG